MTSYILLWSHKQAGVSTNVAAIARLKGTLPVASPGRVGMDTCTCVHGTWSNSDQPVCCHLLSHDTNHADLQTMQTLSVNCIVYTSTTPLLTPTLNCFNLKCLPRPAM